MQCYASSVLSVCLSVTLETAEYRPIIKLLSAIILALSLPNTVSRFRRSHPRGGRYMQMWYENRDFRTQLVVSRKRYLMDTWLLWNANRKSHMISQTALLSTTLSTFEGCFSYWKFVQSQYLDKYSIQHRRSQKLSKVTREQFSGI